MPICNPIFFYKISSWIFNKQLKPNTLLYSTIFQSWHYCYFRLDNSLWQWVVLCTADVQQHPWLLFTICQQYPPSVTVIKISPDIMKLCMKSFWTENQTENLIENLLNSIPPTNPHLSSFLYLSKRHQYPSKNLELILDFFSLPHYLHEMQL